MAILFGLIALAAIAGFLAVLISGPKAPQQQESHQPKPAEQKDAAKPAAHERHQEQAQCGAQDEKQRDYWERFVCYVEARDKFFTAFGTLVIAAFTVVLACATGFLYFATTLLLRHRSIL